MGIGEWSASDLDPRTVKDDPAFGDNVHYGATLSSWGVLARQLLPGKDDRKFPNIADVLFHSMCIPSFAQQRRLREMEAHSTVRFVRPDVSAEGSFAVDSATSRRFEQIAYDTAIPVLEGADVLTLD